ncbi:MAG: hypothetical protein A2Y22_02890 [Clostridiales bacterium GWD2_32_59]|nr:MAG: hypothetical protein A2Y22_02890 [Clostridiales bacterium GWD2_32_59]
MKVKRKNKKGFTLLELLAVLVILAALATIAIPIFTSKSGTAKQIAHNENVRVLQQQGNAYLMSVDSVPAEDTNITQLMVDNGFIKEIPTNPLPVGDTEAGAYIVTVGPVGNAKVNRTVVEVTGIASGGGGGGESPPVTIAEGAYIQFGEYEGAPIIWRVIKKQEIDATKEGEELLLLADRIITMKPYDAKEPGNTGGDGFRDDYGSNYWGNSNIREWLNSNAATVAWTTQAPDAANVQLIGTAVNPYNTQAGFLTNLTDDERAQIVDVTHRSIVYNELDGHDGEGTAAHGYTNTGVDESVSVGDGSNYNTAYYKNTTDTVFLPSLGELADYVDGVLQHPSTVTDYQIAYTTQQARNQSNYASDPANDTTAWDYWTRDASTAGSFRPRYITDNGMVSHAYAFSGYYGVRPALYLSSSSMTLGAESGATAEAAYTITSFN